MSLKRWVDLANDSDFTDFFPLRFQKKTYGHIHKNNVKFLEKYNSFFQVCDKSIDLILTENTSKNNSYLSEINSELFDIGIIKGWRNEFYRITRDYYEKPILLCERAASTLFGFTTFGVHVNGYVREGEKIKLWVAKRSLKKPTFPGFLDHIVAGGHSEGLSTKETLFKECLEEANINELLASRAIPASSVSYCYTKGETARRSMTFVYDLELPNNFKPTNNDGEVESFFLSDLDEVLDKIRYTEDFKTNCNLVIIDFLIRFGKIDHEDPEFLPLKRSLMGNLKLN